MFCSKSQPPGIKDLKVHQRLSNSIAKPQILSNIGFIQSLSNLSFTTAQMPALYPAFATNKSGFLKVSDLHNVYWEECGNPQGLPVVYVHGGPGGGINDGDRRYFDPSVYRTVLFDQRGCGKSTPPSELTDNTTWHLVSDMEELREFLGIEKWVVFGGSWGSTLSLIYAEKYPDRCLGLILRGIFTLRRKELEWFYQSGAGKSSLPNLRFQLLLHITRNVPPMSSQLTAIRFPVPRFL